MIITIIVGASFVIGIVGGSIFGYLFGNRNRNIREMHIVYDDLFDFILESDTKDDVDDNGWCL